MSSTFLQQAIAEHSSRHTELLNSLSQLENVPDTLKQQTRLVDELQAELEECEANVARLFEKTREQRRNADPGIIPGGLKFSQVFRSRKEKEKERERDERNKRLFAEAMAEETKERERRTELEKALNTAQTSKSELSNQMKEYDTIYAKIDALYALIFNGPTPGFPREDELEQSVQASYTGVERAKAAFGSENEALEILSRSEKTFRECQAKMKDAIYWATASMLAGGRTAEAKEGSSLKAAHALAQKAQAFVREAQQFSTHVRTLENPSIAKELPARKENDTEFHETLKASASELGNTYSQLLAERRACAERAADAKTAVHNAEQAVADRKKELHELRKEIFLEIVSKLKSGELAEPTDLDFEGLQDAPPSYEQQHPYSYSQSRSRPTSHNSHNSRTISLSSLPPNFIGAKQEANGSYRPSYASPPYEHVPSSPIYDPYSSTPTPSTPSASRSDSSRPRTARRPLPRVPQANAG
ncbi:hypothetical protein F5878DRAFT_620755 [Lentinula raphanica]|uniref:Uncharacterized protein n=1 Tax=Lentinula raphanica TaxID=153919 RepID=A0AA38P7W8_9AGAR|nr:hypothetical protein F5880DRAFT_1541182 [Lentinula raphanica]KAJ3837982.1 hypothetical protein F5878DRAFT_620755 [Lentinula raphanica]